MRTIILVPTLGRTPKLSIITWILSLAFPGAVIHTHPREAFADETPGSVADMRLFFVGNSTTRIPAHLLEQFHTVVQVCTVTARPAGQPDSMEDLRSGRYTRYFCGSADTLIHLWTDYHKAPPPAMLAEYGKLSEDGKKPLDARRLGRILSTMLTDVVDMQVVDNVMRLSDITIMRHIGMKLLHEDMRRSTEMAARARVCTLAGIAIPCLPGVEIFNEAMHLIATHGIVCFYEVDPPRRTVNCRLIVSKRAAIDVSKITDIVPATVHHNPRADAELLSVTFELPLPDGLGFPFM